MDNAHDAIGDEEIFRDTSGSSRGEMPEAQEKMTAQTLIPKPSTLISAKTTPSDHSVDRLRTVSGTISWLDSEAPVQISTQSPSAPRSVPRSTQLPTVLGALRPNPFLLEDVSGLCTVPPSSLKSPAESNALCLSSAASQSTLPSPDPLTTTVKNSRTRSLVSCHSCRSAKIRCDRVQPTCLNCTERNAACTYDGSIKRRGPDKNPRTRSRRAAQNGGEKQIRARPYAATRPKNNTLKPSHKAEATSSVVINPTMQSSERRPLDSSPDPPLLSASAVDTLPSPMVPHSIIALTSIPTSDFTSRVQLADAQVDQRALQVQDTPRQAWPTYFAALSARPAPRFPSASVTTSNLRDGRSRGSSESTEYEAQSSSSRDDPSIGREPSLRFSQDTWWDTVLTIYDSTSKSRAVHLVTTDLHEFFRTSSGWLYFVNVPLFFHMFYDPEQRAMMQPALVLSFLTYSAFAKGSETEGGEEQRQKALRLRNLGQAAFDASYNAGWIDVPLAQASWVFALFEACIHPEASTARMGSSLCVMDNVISVLGLTSIDAEHARSPVVFLDTVPAIGRRGPEGFNTDTTLSVPPPFLTSGHQGQNHPNPQYMPFVPATSIERHCPCELLTMQGEPDQLRSNPLWLMTPKWDQDVPHAVMRREEGRRLVWSALRLVAGDINRRLPSGTPLLDLELAKPNNYALLYPGEHMYHQDNVIDTAYSSKESTWALYARVLHLWVACTMYHDATASLHDKTDFATKTWMETIAIEDALNEHNCDGERSTMYQTREYLFNIRMFISDQYRRSIPIPQSEVNFSHFDRRRAMQWLTHQRSEALQIRASSMGSSNSYAAKAFVQHPFFIWWQRAQMWRALNLFDMDNSLIFAVDVVLDILPLFLFLQGMWPCAEQRRLSQPVMDRLRRACQKTGRTVPPPLSLPDRQTPL